VSPSSAHEPRPRRALVIGTSCAGKTTFARTAAPVLGVPHYDLDDLHWGPNWTTNPDYQRELEAVVAGDAWILSGNYGSARQVTWPRADTVFWLDYPFWLVFGRSLVRTLRRVITRERLFAGNVETFRAAFLSRDGIPCWVVRTYRRRRRQYRELQSSNLYPHVRWVVFRHPREERGWLARAATSAQRSASRSQKAESRSQNSGEIRY